MGFILFTNIFIVVKIKVFLQERRLKYKYSKVLAILLKKHGIMKQ